MRVERVIIINRAPYNSLDLHFGNESIDVLAGYNGSGKTTIASYIVDALYEMAKKGYSKTFENIENQYYRISTSIYVKDRSKPSIVYIRFENSGKNVDYVDFANRCDELQYNTLINLNDKIKFEKIKPILEENFNGKFLSDDSKEMSNGIFDNNLLTYFPSYRFEQPFYLNNPYKIHLDFKKENDFSGTLSNPIEVDSDIPNIVNWMLDVILDEKASGMDTRDNLVNINKILNGILLSDRQTEFLIGLGPRNLGASRIAVTDLKGNVIYPSIFTMSSGELSVLAIFAELLKQADKINQPIEVVNGIVIIDEVDKHLHLKLQKEILPNLFKLFPNIQFIITNHSPFVNLGINEQFKNNYKLFDLNNNGAVSEVLNTAVYKDAYDVFIQENENILEKLNLVENRINDNSKPLLITEGKTDWKHLKNALNKLNISDFDVEIFEYEQSLGDAGLQKLLETLSFLKFDRIIIGLFDRDNEEIIKYVNSDGTETKFLSSNVIATLIPAVNEDEYGPSISIEHYYSRNDLTICDANGRRLFLGDEFYESGNNKDGNYRTKTSKIQHKVKINGIIDEKVFKNNDLKEENSVALSKNGFVENILNNVKEFSNVDVTNFNKIFDRVKEVVNKSKKDETDFT